MMAGAMTQGPSPSVEALRQQALLAAIRAGDPSGSVDHRSRQTVASPARPRASRAVLLPTAATSRPPPSARCRRPSRPCAAMVGAGDFGRLVREYLRDEPPRDGDLGEWGATFASWLGRHALLAEWPYLGDCAALDHAVHRCERAADAVFDAGVARRCSNRPTRPACSFGCDPAPPCCRPPGRSRRSTRPTATRRPISAPPAPRWPDRRAEQVLVVRSGWRGAVVPIDLPTADWTRSLLDGIDLAARARSRR